MTVKSIYSGSDAAATRALYARLQTLCGPAGVIAMDLFRAQKASARAKVYRGGVRGVASFRDLAYEKKNWSLQNLCAALAEHAAGLGITWGWREDPAQSFHNWVLYVELPTGQVSFHAATRGLGPDYPRDWDGWKLSAERIVEYVDKLLSGCTAAGEEVGSPVGNATAQEHGVEPPRALPAARACRAQRPRSRSAVGNAHVQLDLFARKP
ncbi:MAG TPA: hypothetical protein VGQ93_16740 [Lysobacter sp.]|jgi:hypothetical protein|nr:hypothetical protein [Lysobacter sp.]